MWLQEGSQPHSKNRQIAPNKTTKTKQNKTKQNPKPNNQKHKKKSLLGNLLMRHADLRSVLAVGTPGGSGCVCVLLSPVPSAPSNNRESALCFVACVF
jgi:CO dehydrogenase nickel-insertion accessory protein CooC1